MTDVASHHDPERKPPVSVKEAYDIFASQISKEDQLIVSRMSWGLTANGAVITLFGALFAFLNSPYSALGATQKNLAVLLSALVFPVVAFEIYHQTIQAIWVARQQLYRLRASYHSHWASVFHEAHLPVPYGARETRRAGDHGAPSFFAYPTVVLRGWVPFAGRLHGRRLGPIELVHLPLYTGDLSERSWFAEKILFSGLCLWVLVFAVVLASLLSPHP